MNTCALSTLKAQDLGIPSFPLEAIPDISPESAPHAFVPYYNVHKPDVTHWLVQMHSGNLSYYTKGGNHSGPWNSDNIGDLDKLIVHNLSFDVGTINPLWGEATFWKRVNTMREFGVHTMIAPDFSAWADFPIALQIYNLYRSAMVARDLVRAGFKVIPNVTWSLDALTSISFSVWPREARLILVDASHVHTKRWSMNQDIFWQGARRFREYWPEVTPWLWASSLKVVEKWRNLIGPCTWCPTRVYVLSQLQRLHHQESKQQLAVASA
jgi:hypothetical protein